MEYWGEKFKELCKVLEDSIVFCFSVNGIKDDGKYWAILFFVVIARDCTILWGLADKKKNVEGMTYSRYCQWNWWVFCSVFLKGYISVK